MSVLPVPRTAEGRAGLAAIVTDPAHALIVRIGQALDKAILFQAIDTHADGAARQLQRIH